MQASEIAKVRQDTRNAALREVLELIEAERKEHGYCLADPITVKIEAMLKEN